MESHISAPWSTTLSSLSDPLTNASDAQRCRRQGGFANLFEKKQVFKQHGLKSKYSKLRGYLRCILSTQVCIVLTWQQQSQKPNKATPWLWSGPLQIWICQDTVRDLEITTSPYWKHALCLTSHDLQTAKLEVMVFLLLQRHYFRPLHGLTVCLDTFVDACVDTCLCLHNTGSKTVI